MGMIKRWARGLLACVVLHTALYLGHVNQVLGGINLAQVVANGVCRMVHWATFKAAASTAQVVPYAESFLYPKTIRRTGLYRCIRFQYTGTGECPNIVNDIVGLFLTPNHTEPCDAMVSTSMYGVPGHCVV
ncbi:hypothetical protein H310_11206 [Aphanomyces invadans]|uniref:Uncharacterized protein n=1 Tax=Aphanomyces invadans TaxID=157072 RepID=A0A024TMQ0_9STRA|nr:hypothetical protein H310_11206 [Aphanomyces invadans]ETV95308.1 hypothetical protein H310_11206 [Aphanomyces invadans]|eukprot:XP_008876009.1 hypothetical protein H310_11206 [Aphanomyces invadans]